ncbi:MAG: aquaporin [Planctomycetota bacterium]|nr:aquaporin [Planctomycetota bacterium]
MLALVDALRAHWPEYLIEATLLGALMVSACVSVRVVQHDASPLRRRIPSAFARRALIGVLMGLTAVALIYSPLGQRSGAHMNPATTLAFFTLGKIGPWDALWYIAAQFIGGAGGVLVARALLGPVLRHPTVNYVLTTPGRWGSAAAWGTEFALAFALMGMVLLATNDPRTASYTGLFAGCMVALYITLAAPLSGMSINPARTFGSAVVARRFASLWIYFTAPTLAMLSAAGAYAAAFGADHVLCAKLNHDGGGRCIFRCHIHDKSATPPRRTPDAGIGEEVRPNDGRDQHTQAE